MQHHDTARLKTSRNLKVTPNPSTHDIRTSIHTCLKWTPVTPGAHFSSFFQVLPWPGAATQAGLGFNVRGLIGEILHHPGPNYCNSRSSGYLRWCQILPCMVAFFGVGGKVLEAKRFRIFIRGNMPSLQVASQKTTALVLS